MTRRSKHATRSLCYLGVLCDSVVSVFSESFTTESQRTLRMHREECDH